MIQVFWRPVVIELGFQNKQNHELSTTTKRIIARKHYDSETINMRRTKPKCQITFRYREITHTLKPILAVVFISSYTVVPNISIFSNYFKIEIGVK